MYYLNYPYTLVCINLKAGKISTWCGKSLVQLIPSVKLSRHPPPLSLLKAKSHQPLPQSKSFELSNTAPPISKRSPSLRSKLRPAPLPLKLLSRSHMVDLHCFLIGPYHSFLIFSCCCRKQDLGRFCCPFNRRQVWIFV